MTTHAIDLVTTPEETAAWGLSGLLAAVLRRVRKVRLTAEQKKLRHLARFSFQAFGQPLLESENLDDLDERMEAILGSADFHNTMVLLAGLAVHVEAITASPTPGLADLCGERARGALRVVAAGDRLEAAMVDAYRQFLKQLPRERLGNAVEEMRALRPLEFVTDAATPPEVALACLGILRATVSMIALGAMIARTEKVAPWLCLGLAERRRLGLKSYLQLLASFPGINVPTSVIPEESRLDLRAIQARNELAHLRVAELLEREAAPLGPEWD